MMPWLCARASPTEQCLALFAPSAWVCCWNSLKLLIPPNMVTFWASRLGSSLGSPCYGSSNPFWRIGSKRQCWRTLLEQHWLLVCGFLQGSVLMLILFDTYMKPLDKVFWGIGIKCHQYVVKTKFSLPLAFTVSHGSCRSAEFVS